MNNNDKSELKNILCTIKEARGGIARIHSAFSQFPVGMKAHFEFYDKIMLGENLPLSREDREFLAVETSRANECPYCVGHHEEAFRKILKEKKFEKSSKETARQNLLKQFAMSLTKEPWKASNFHDQFLKEGLTEAQWQHAIMVVSYFNFANRLAHSQNLDLEQDFEVTCN